MTEGHDVESVSRGGARWRMREYVRVHGQMLMNVYLFINMAIWVAWRTYGTWAKGELGYVEVAFAVQNVILLAVILSRRSHQAVDRNVFRQLVAVLAFYSGLAFMGQPSTGGVSVQIVSKGILLVSHILSAMCLLTLGRSFGILIALRKVRTSGVYGIVRHPMYAADMLLRIGFVVSHLNWGTVILCVASGGCYVYRAVLEERFLSQTQEYRDYMQRVKYRFIPFLI